MCVDILDKPMGLANSISFMEPSRDRQPEAVRALSEVWAQRYLQSLEQQDSALETAPASDDEIADRLSQALRSTSVEAWMKTEALLAKEVMRHQIDKTLINPWDISQDVHGIFCQAIDAFAVQLPPQKLTTKVSKELDQIRQKYTQVDPRVIGFASMQFHYTGQSLLSLAPPTARSLLSAYFKVIDDHLYMPLQRAYRAAANLSFDDPRLQAVRSLLPVCSEMAQRIVKRVATTYPSYRCHTGYLNESAVLTSSMRDAEMFQVYLWVCVLEENISAIQQELFPLCVMLYPRLKVRWELVRQLIHLLNAETQAYLPPDTAAFFTPYYEALWAMFSPRVFPDSP